MAPNEMTSELLSAYYKSKGEETPSQHCIAISEIVESAQNFTEKIKALDTEVAKLQIPDDIGELLFDILLFNFFSEDSQRLGEQFFESKDWQKIEDSIIDRGTELMNILLYLQECKDSGIKVTLDDYLDEYLIGEDELDKDELEVYEAIIKNRDEIVTSDSQTMIELANCNLDSPLGDQLLPILLFFETKDNLEIKHDLILKAGSNPPFQSCFLAVLSSF